jgi:integrase
MGGRGMRTRKPYPYVHEVTDRHGHRRAYFRKRGYPSVALPLPIGSRAFLEAYHAALEAAPTAVKGKAKPGTIAALVDLHYRSRKWNDLSPGSQRTYWNRSSRSMDNRLVDQMEAKHVDAIMDAKAGTPVAANRLRKLLSVMMRIAIRQGWRKDNPVIAVENFKIRSRGHRPWTVDEIERFEAFYPIGSEERLAFALLLYTGQRVSDVVGMGRQHVRDGIITIKQKKGQETVEVSIPICGQLKLILDEVQNRRIAPTFLLNQFWPAEERKRLKHDVRHMVQEGGPSA